jgi:hypothetical protein
VLIYEQNAVAKRELFVRKSLHRFVEGGTCEINVADCGHRPTNVKRRFVPQLEAVIQVGDVVQIRAFDFSEQLTNAEMQVRILTSRQPALGT